MPTTLKKNHYYYVKEYGMFRVGLISKNGFLVTIYDTYNDKHVVICRYLEEAAEVARKDYMKELRENSTELEYAW